MRQSAQPAELLRLAEAEHRAGRHASALELLRLADDLENEATAQKASSVTGTVDEYPEGFADGDMPSQ